MDMVGPYYHPLQVQPSPDSSCLLTMLTTREGGAAASAPKRAEDDGEASDVGVDDLGDRGRRKQAAPPALVWFWRRKEDKTEETPQTIQAAGVLNNLN